MKYTSELRKHTDDCIYRVNITVERDYFSTTFEGFRPQSIRGETKVQFKGKTYWCESGGCSSEIIKEIFPEFTLFADLHSSDLTGKPMHHIENGFYHFIHDKEVGQDYLRMTDDQATDCLKEVSKKNSKARFTIFLEDTMYPIWRAEAIKGLTRLGELTGTEWELTGGDEEE